MLASALLAACLLLLLSLCPRCEGGTNAPAANATRKDSGGEGKPLSKGVTTQAAALNVLGTALQTCNNHLMTGWYRDGSCRTDTADTGLHSVCAVVTDDFLQYMRQVGNNLITPVPQNRFPGLVHGDAWCLCAGRWLQAHAAGKAPPILLSATERSAIDVIPLEVIREFGAGTGTGTGGSAGSGTATVEAEVAVDGQ